MIVGASIVVSVSAAWKIASRNVSSDAFTLMRADVAHIRGRVDQLYDRIIEGTPDVQP